MIVRPEMIRIKKTGELFKGIIRRAVYLGDVIEYDVEVKRAIDHRLGNGPLCDGALPGRRTSDGWICRRLHPGFTWRSKRMPDFDILMIGNFAKDKLIVDGIEEIASGGGVYYGSVVVKRLGAQRCSGHSPAPG